MLKTFYHRYLAHPRTNSTGGVSTPTPTSASPNNQQIEHCSILSARMTSESPYSEMLDLIVTPKQATDDVLQIADFSNVGHLPRSSPQVSRNVRLKFKPKAKRQPTQPNQ